MVVLGPLVLVAVVVGLLARWLDMLGFRGSRIVRWSASGLWLILTLVCAMAFYERFWIWRDCFDELGRCYDSDAGVMTKASGPIWGILTVLFGALFLRSALILRSGQTPGGLAS
jgi:hypothetical protein